MGLTTWNDKPGRYGRHDRLLETMDWRDQRRALAEAQSQIAQNEARREREVAHLYRERERQTTRLLVLQVLLCLAAFVLVLSLVGNGCGDVQAEPVDTVRAQQLAKAMLDWQPTTRVHEDKLREYAGLFVAACKRMRQPIPDRDGCPELLAAVTFRESSWQERAIGSRGEVGLFQVHGLALSGVPPTMALDPATNVRLGVQWLDYAARMCAQWQGKDTYAERSLSAYAGLGCVTSRTARLALRYALEIAGER